MDSSADYLNLFFFHLFLTPSFFVSTGNNTMPGVGDAAAGLLELPFLGGTYRWGAVNFWCLHPGFFFFCPFYKRLFCVS